MSNKMTPEGKRLNVVAMAWWRYWQTVSEPTSLSSFLADPSTRDLISACADLDALQGRTQREQLDRYSGPGSVEKQLWAVSRNWPDPAAIDTVAGQGIGSAGDEQV